MLFNFIPEEAKVYNIKDMYGQSREDDKPLLSTYQSDFWAGYRANYQHLDRLFMKKYSSLIPIDQDYEAGLEDITNDFRFDVYSWLLANDKRYTELFRVNSIADDTAYSLINNVDYTETTERTSNRDIEFNKGAQADSDEGFTAYGQQQIDDDKSKTVGQQIVEEDMSKTFGAINNDTTNSKSSYNDTTFSPVEKSENDIDAHTDTEDNNITYGSHTDTEDNTLTYGAHRDDRTNIHNEGSRRDTTDDDLSESMTTHKVGNMGVQTVDDMLKKHWENWTLFDFYGLIFSDIAQNLLRGC